MDATHFNLRHLRAFVAVAHLRNISEAARRIHLSQPALTQAIAKLEKQLGVKLFDRRPDGMFITEAGQLFLSRTERALHFIEYGARLAARAGRKSESNGPARFDHLITSAQLRALLAVSKTGNFSLAARQLGVSQPTLHRTARELEQVSNIQLYEKISQGIAMTRAAIPMTRFTRLAFAEFNQAVEDIENWRGQDTGRMIIGTLPLARTFVLPHAINALSRERPDVEVSVIDGPYEDLLHGLRHGEIDMLIGALRDPLPVGDIEQRPLFDDRLTIVGRHGHPLMNRAGLQLEDLTHYPWIVPRMGTPTRENFEILFAGRDDLRPKHVIEASSLILIRGLLTGSDRLTLISAHQVRHEESLNVLRRLDFDVPTVPRPIGVTLREGWRPTPSQKRMLELLEEAGLQAPMFQGRYFKNE
jgi:DNA-binding transcriptional LysR family regulator